MINEPFAALAGIALGVAVGWATFQIVFPPNKDLIRDCSITGVHILDSETVVVCKVVKVRTQEVPSPTNTKPEVTL